MHNIPEVTLATAEAQAQQIYRVKSSDEILENMTKHFVELYATNPILTITLTNLIKDMLSVASINKMNKESKTPEEFASKMEILVISITYTILKMIDAQIEANNMKEMFQ